MKRIYLLFYLSFFMLNIAFGQGGTWTWISGDSSNSVSGAFGTQGVPSINNHPPRLYEAVDWKDKHGNFWLYGGDMDSAIFSTFSDLWKYNPLTNEWTWVKGSSLTNQPAVYGTKGVPDSSNTPGKRAWGCASWVDTAGNLWLFGGGVGYGGNCNDLWKYDIGTNTWTWMSGDSTLGGYGVYGTQGIPSPSNEPPARTETSSSWTDSNNNLWIFGGVDGSLNGFSDLWKYDIAADEWTWMKGSSSVNALPSFGTKGVANVSNDPGNRETYAKWKDLEGNFWLMGGWVTTSGVTDDFWKYDVSTNEWTWMYGTNVYNDGGGSVQNTCVFDTLNLPVSRWEHRSAATDSYGRFWLFGGGGDVCFNDLWVFDPQQMKCECIRGNFNQPANYGTKGVPSTSNMPPSRFGALAWWGNNNKFYLFGGMNTNSNLIMFSDLWVFDPDTNCISMYDVSTSFLSNKTTICANDCINFTDLSTYATSWQWSFAGALDSTSTDENPQNICYSKAGIYNVTLIASNAASSDTVTFTNYITVTPTPPTPVITQHQDHDTLYCSFDTSYYTYKWFYDSTFIAGATDTFLIISKSGNYNVQVTNKNGCTIAGGINVVLGIENYSNDHFISIYPNPATDELLIDGNWSEGLRTPSEKMEDGNLKLTILNVLGQVIYAERLLRSSQQTVNCHPFPSGIYFVEVANESGRWVGKFVKE